MIILTVKLGLVGFSLVSWNTAQIWDQITSWLPAPSLTFPWNYSSLSIWNPHCKVPRSSKSHRCFAEPWCSCFPVWFTLSEICWGLSWISSQQPASLANRVAGTSGALVQSLCATLWLEQELLLPGILGLGDSHWGFNLILINFTCFKI